MFNIEFEPVGRRGDCEEGQSLLDCARRLGVELVAICGGIGECERCKVQVLSGVPSKPTKIEDTKFTNDQLNQGYRLACQAYPSGDTKIFVPTESLTAPQRTQVEGLESAVPVEPVIDTMDVQLAAPSLADPKADDLNLIREMAEKQGRDSKGFIDHQVMRGLSQQIRELDWRVRLAVRGEEIIALGSNTSRWLGLAVDIGTTKIAAYLVDLENGQILAARGRMNPQISYGEDVISRIASANRTSGSGIRLQELIIQALNQMIVELCSEVIAKPAEVVDAVVVGNTVMHHLFLDLPVGQLGASPYVPAVCSAIDIKARELGLQIALGAYVHLLPNIAGYVGADHVAMILATGISESDGIVLGLDIGTNTEICLNLHGKLTSVSCASGPAFEGAHIRFGMRASQGAIEHVRWTGEKLEYQTIGDVPPAGICGSGLVDCVAQLYLNGILDRTGRMGSHPRVRNRDQIREYMIVDEAERKGLEAITLSQKDVRELQLAKAAIRLGIQALVESKGLAESDIEQVFIAGAFGTYIEVPSAIAIGMFPTLPLGIFKQVGNAAGSGARLALISRSKRLEAQEIAKRVEYIELANLPDFQKKFTDATYLG